ncbi:PREDICTED: receptor-like protein 12 [Camelina sativa]|uniref:Receptor-like protein 12 n=1 Tax=Camelina sativa TaxID=90675 RepID=A0ABM1QC47_CAMSA|nr:PREDICTED: receptor-like protein 12 [Camelina sativa]
MDQSAAVVKNHIEKPFVFRGVDFKRWQQKMLFYLTTLNLAQYVTSEAPELPVEGDISDEIIKASEAWTQNEFLCNNYILNALDDSLYDVYHIFQSPKQLWESLEKKYKSEVASAKKIIVGKFLNFKMSDTIPVVKQVEEIQVTAHELKDEVKLKTFDVQNNSLSSKIPDGIGNLVSLSVLSLSLNKLSGGIPSSIRNLKNLETLELENTNGLSGQIPTAWLFGLQKLEILRLGGNKLQWDNNGFSFLQSKLTHLSLRSCGLQGNIPDWLKNQTSLVYLDLSMNRLEGRFPAWLSNLTIGIIILSDNRLSGSLPPHLFQSGSLSCLVLSRNNFSGQIPDTTPISSSIRVLMLSENNFTGSVPNSITKGYTTLLDLSKNRLSGEFPRFGLPKNRLSGEFPGLGPYLVWLDISSNEFSGDIPSYFGSAISMLLMNDNNFNGEFPKNFRNLSRLIRLDLHDNKISGEFASLTSRLPYSLEVLSLRNNSLKGSIPESISNLTRLQVLDLSENNLDGYLPSSLRNLTCMIKSPVSSSSAMRLLFSFNTDVERLIDIKAKNIFSLVVNWKKSKQVIFQRNFYLYTLIDLSKNKLHGEIPASLGNLKSLKLLNLSNNEFSGSIPQSFGDLDTLESLDLSHNNLIGEIPKTLSKLSELNTLDLSNNKLTGRIPEGPQLDRLNDPNIYANNSEICGVQIQVPCSTQEMEPSNEEEEETMFSWKAAAIGCICGFLIALVFMYNEKMWK